MSPTYVMVGDGMDMETKWQGLAIVPTRSAMNELYKYGMTLGDVGYILEEGYDCNSGRRKKDVYEKCICWGGKTVKVVVVRTQGIFSGRDEWAIVHAGIFARRK